MKDKLTAKEFKDSIRTGELTYEKGKFKVGNLSKEYKKMLEDKRKGWVQGWRNIGGKDNYYRSRWEANYARYLQLLKENGEIGEWEHEPDTFWFHAIKRGVRSYLPDFKVTHNNGDIVYHEVKGWYDKRSKTKLKRMAKYYPDVKLEVIDKDFFTTNNKRLKTIIKDYESS